MKYISSTFMMLTCCKLFFFFFGFSNENLKMYWSRNLGGTIYLLALGALEHKDGPDHRHHFSCISTIET